MMDAFLNLNELSESSIKTYNASYNKLTDLLGQPIEESNPRNIIRKINTVTNPNSQKALIVILRKMYPEVKAYHVMFRHLKKKIAEYKDKSLANLTLPSVFELKRFMDTAYLNGEYKKYIINYLLINFNVRNKDLDLIITTKRDLIDDDKNYLYVASSYISYIRNDYKTVKTYGEKRFPIKSTKFYRAVTNFLGEDETKYLFNLKDSEVHIAPSTIGKMVRKYTLDEVGESIYFKAIVLDLVKNGNTKQIDQLSRRRGTDVNTIIDSYLKE